MLPRTTEEMCGPTAEVRPQPLDSVAPKSLFANKAAELFEEKKLFSLLLDEIGRLILYLVASLPTRAEDFHTNGQPCWLLTQRGAARILDPDPGGIWGRRRRASNGVFA